MAYDGIKAPASEEVATILFRNLFEKGRDRLSANAAYIAKQMIMGGLREWKAQLLEEADGRLSHANSKFDSLKKDFQELKLKYEILCKDIGRKP